MENLQDSTLFEEIQPLEKHSYPLWVKIFSLSIFLLSIWVVMHFVRHDLPQHRKIGTDLAKAEQLFLRKEYADSLQLYMSIVEEYPEFKAGRKRVIQSCFALSNEDARYCLLGLRYMQEEFFSFTEHIQLCAYAPEEFKDVINELTQRA